MERGASIAKAGTGLPRDIQLAPTNVRFWLMAEFTAGQQLPSLDGREFVAAGGLMSYGANIANLFRRAADYVDGCPNECPLLGVKQTSVGHSKMFAFDP